MAKKVYAIKEGFDFKANEKVKDIIVETWAECLKYTKGVKGAKYKSFPSNEEAREFLSQAKEMLKKGVDAYPEDCLHIYVDGSYNIASEKYSFGMVAVQDDIVEYIESSEAKDTSQKNIRQIAGELQAAVKGVEYALSNNHKKVLIFHDYEGIAHHATGFWDRKEPSSMMYYSKMQEFMAQGIEIIFVKVDSHTGELFNELADEKCKERLGIESERIVDKWLSKNTLKVSSEEVKKEILSITKNKEDKIIIVKSNSSNSIDPLETSSKENSNHELIIEGDKAVKDVLKEINNILLGLPIEKQLKALEVIKNI